MACCKAAGDEDKQNELINKQLKEEKKRLDSEIKLLLLGN